MVFLSTAVRRGRYTHQIKVKNIIEAKKHLEKGPYSVPSQKGVASSLEVDTKVRLVSPAGSGSLSSPPSSGDSVASELTPSPESTLPVTVNGLALAPGQITGNGFTSGDSEIGDLLEEALKTEAMVEIDPENFNYTPEAFANIDFDVSSRIGVRFVTTLKTPFSGFKQFWRGF